MACKTCKSRKKPTLRTYLIQRFKSKEEWIQCSKCDTKFLIKRNEYTGFISFFIMIIVGITGYISYSKHIEEMYVNNYLLHFIIKLFVILVLALIILLLSWIITWIVSKFEIVNE